MDKRGNSREPFDKVSLNVRTLQWPVVLEAKRMKWTVGCGGHAAGAGADYVASTPAVPAACTLLPQSCTWLAPEPSGGAQQSSVP